MAENGNGTIDSWRGRWALVTGASAGIGWALAEELAAGGAHLVLTARRRDRLDQLAQSLRRCHGISIEVCTADLTQPDAPGEILAFTESKGITVDLLVNNAGLGDYGEFHASDLGKQLAMVQVNCLAVVHLTHLYLKGMVERQRGDILIVASTASYQAVAYISTYAATKAFDLLFAEGLAQEVARYGVRVCALCPGPTTSEFQAVAGTPQRSGVRMEPADKVARVGLRALAGGKHSVISGWTSWLGVQGQRLAPRRLVTGAAAAMYRPEQLRRK
jgi:short-subunit dehydrogenase